MFRNLRPTLLKLFRNPHISRIEPCIAGANGCEVRGLVSDAVGRDVQETDVNYFRIISR